MSAERPLLWPQLEPLIAAHQPEGYTPAKQADGALVFHSPLRPDSTPSFVVWPDTPGTAGGRYGWHDRGTHEGGNLRDLLARLTGQDEPSANGHRPGTAEARRPQTMAQFCAERKLDPTMLSTVYGVHEVVDEKSRRPALEFPTPLGVNRRKFLDGDKRKGKYKWHPAGSGGTNCWYGLPQEARRGGHTLYVVNGAPSVWACYQAHVPAICYEGGEGKIPTPEDVAYLRGALDHWTSFRQLRVIYDLGEAHDKPGKGSRAVAAALRRGRIAATAYGLPPDMGKGADVDDLHRRVGAGLADALLALPQLDLGEAPADELDVISIDDLLDKPPPDDDWQVEGLLLAAGTSMVGAKPKFGKSVFARCAAYCQAKGIPFLGRAVVQGRVLYLAFEDKEAEVRHHFEKLGCRGLPLDLRFGRRPEELLQKLQRYADKHADLRFVVLDPLFRAIDFKDGDDYAEVYAKMEPLEQIARSGPHIMVTHHEGKGDERHGREGGDKILGSTALFASVDSFLDLTKRPIGRTLAAIQRSMSGADLEPTVIDLDPETWMITVAGTLSVVQDQRTRAAILEALGNQPRTEDDIKDRVGGDVTLVSKTLRKMCDEAQVQRLGDGKKGSAYKYHNPKTYTPPVAEGGIIHAEGRFPDQQAQRKPSPQLVVRDGGWDDLVAAWAAQHGAAPIALGEVYALSATVQPPPFTWPEEWSERGRERKLRPLLEQLARDATVLAGHVIVDRGRKEQGHCWSLLHQTPADPDADAQANAFCPANRPESISADADCQPAPADPDADAQIVSSPPYIGPASILADSQRQRQHNFATEVTRANAASVQQEVPPGPSTLALGPGYIGVARDVDHGVGAALTEGVRTGIAGFSADPSWSDVRRIPLADIPRRLDPEKVRSVVEGAGQAYPILRTVTELEAALAAYHGLVGLDVEARDTELTAPLEALQLALYPVDREPILAVLHWPQWGEAPGAPLPVCLVRQLQRPDLIPVGHNISTYDLPILARHGCDLTNRPTIDTMVQERVLLQGQFRDEERAGKGLDYPGLGLSDCLLRRLRVWLGKAAQQKGIGARLAAPTMCEDDLRYCALDILFLGALVTMQWRHATERQRHAMKLETEVQSLLTGITVRGLAVNLERLAEAREEQLEKMPEPLAHIRELLPEVRMTASGRLSDKSLSTLIERDYGIDPASRAWGAKENREREREGKAPLPPRIFLNEQVRTEVRMENYAWKDVAEPLDAYKQADSLAARLTPTYLKVLEGRIFPRVIGLATRNWRMTMVEPNAQQIAHDYRDVVVADASCVFVSVDLSQIEARLAAVVSQDEAMLHATEHDDVYLAIAAHHHGVDMDGLDPARRATLRKSSKIIVLALQYGGGTQAVRAQMLAQNKPCSVDDAKCKIDEYMQRFPGVKRMVERAWAEERGCREHRRGLAIDYTSGGTRTFRTEELKGTKFTPARISSLAATAFKLSLLLLKDRGWGPYLAMVLHDEISLHVPRHMSQQAARDLVECLTQGVALVCPEANARVGDPVIGKTWSKKGDDLGPGDEVSDEGEA